MNRLLLLLILLGPAGVAAARKPVTLESVTREGRAGAGPAAVHWAPDGKRFVWQQGNKVMVYDVGARSEKELFGTDEIDKAAKTPLEPPQFGWENRGVREQRLQWSASGREILLLRKGDIFLYRLEPAKWEQLTATADAEHDPKLSPDGRLVSFRRVHELYTIDIARKKTTRLTQDSGPLRWNAELDWVYPEELSIGTAYWWSPDSRSIAYLQFDVSQENLYPHADLLKLHAIAEPQRFPYAGTPNAAVRLGVVPAAGGKTRWLAGTGPARPSKQGWNSPPRAAPSSVVRASSLEDTAPPADGLIARVDWVPARRELMVQRLTRIQNRLDLIAFDVDSGKSRLIVQESDPHWINVKDDLRLLRNSPRFLWSSERDGFRHLYLYSFDGRGPARLTSGAWEVSEVAAVDENADRVYYLSTEASPLERHLYSVKFDGADKRRLTRDAGTHGVSMAPSAEFYVRTFSSLTQPSSRTLHSADGVEIAVLRPADRKVLDEYEILPTDLVGFAGSDGDAFHGRLIRPAGFEPGRKYPAIVMVYGGPHAQTVRNSWRGADWDQALAHRGFVIWQMDNRGSAGRGHGFETPLHRRFGAQELADQLDGIRHLVSLGFVDPKRIGIYGWSYGGYMTLYSLLHSPETFAAGIAGAPVTDWRQYDTIYTERYMGLPAGNEEGYKKSSPVHAAKNLQGRLMLVHNFEDDNVLFQHTLRMVDALQKEGKQFDFLLYPQKSHGVTGPARRHMLEAMTAFFERHLNH